MSKTQYQSRHVSLRLAYAWDCPLCGREVFERGVVPEMAPDDLQNMREDYGVEPWVEGDFLLSPDSVECPFCKVSFSTEYFRDDTEEDSSDETEISG